MYFSFIPPIKVVGSVKDKLNIPGLDIVKEIQITPNEVTIYVDHDYQTKALEIFTFKTVVPEAFRWIDPNDLPIELIPMASVEIIEDIAKLIGGFALLYDDLPKSGYLEFFRGDMYPLSIRRPDKSSYSATVQLKRMPKGYFTSMDSALRQNIEEQLEYTLKTFLVNVIYPFEHKFTKSEINTIEADMKKFVSRTRDLITIINSSFPLIEERQKAFLRLALPIMLKQTLIDGFSDYFSFENTPFEHKLSINKHKEIKAEDILRIFKKFLV